MNVSNFTANQLDCMNLVGTLTGKTAKGKQRIKQWGSQGKIMRTLDVVQFSQDSGPWFAITAGDPTFRWVHATRDPDFTIDVQPWNGDSSTRTHTTTKDD